MADVKTITPEMKLQAFALFVMAKNHSIKSVEYETAMHEVLGIDRNGNHTIGDEIWGDNVPPSAATFDTALKRAGVVVEGAST